MNLIVNDCPFCGHQDVEIDEVSIGEYSVTCPECRAIGPVFGDAMDAIDQWNKAAAPAPTKNICIVNTFDSSVIGDYLSSATQAGSGDITPAAAAASTSLASCSTDAGQAVVEPPKPDEAPAEARSDEIDAENLFDFEIPGLGAEDDSDERADQRFRRLICSASTDGQVTLHRVGSIGLVLTADEAAIAYEFLSDTARIWAPKSTPAHKQSQPT